MADRPPQPRPGAAPEPAETGLRAYVSRLQLLTAMACLLPLLVIGFCALTLLPGAPLAVRLIGLVILAPMAIWLLIALRLLALREPLIEINRHGLLWRRWSGRRIDWQAVAHWRVKHHLGIGFVTFWLKDPAAHRATTIQRLLAPGNRMLGMGDVTLNAAGTACSFEALVEAIRRHAPPPDLPEDPRLARRLLAARRRSP